MRRKRNAKRQQRKEQKGSGRKPRRNKLRFSQKPRIAGSKQNGVLWLQRPCLQLNGKRHTSDRCERCAPLARNRFALFSLFWLPTFLLVGLYGLVLCSDEIEAKIKKKADEEAEQAKGIADAKRQREEAKKEREAVC